MALNEQPNLGMVPPPNARRKGREPTGDPKNPYGLGDPDDKSLRKVETEIMVPMKIRDRTKAEKCPELVQSFSECAKAAGLLMVVKCRHENSAMKSCMERWYHDKQFIKECTEEYLKERSQYRKTGIKQKELQRYLA